MGVLLTDELAPIAGQQTHDFERRGRVRAWQDVLYRQGKRDGAAFARNTDGQRWESLSQGEREDVITSHLDEALNRLKVAVRATLADVERRYTELPRLFRNAYAEGWGDGV